jgi:hypothetical protein
MGRFFGALLMWHSLIAIFKVNFLQLVFTHFLVSSVSRSFSDDFDSNTGALAFLSRCYSLGGMIIW